MKNTVKGFLFRLPAILLIIACFIASLIIKLNANLNAQYPLNWATPFILLIILVLYFVGEYLSSLRHSVFAI